MTWRERYQKAKEIARGLKEDYQTVKKAKESGELKKEIKMAEKAESKGELSYKEKLYLKGLKIIQGKPKRPIRNARKRPIRHSKKR